MNIVKINDKNDLLIKQLVKIWEDSVKSTHDFLSQKEIENIKTYVPQALCEVEHLLVIEKNQTPFGFMGINKERLEMLFIASDMIGKGYGKKLLDYGIRHYFVNELCVNEQNPLARAFYERMGFVIYKRSDLDEQGNPYPLLYMKRA